MEDRKKRDGLCAVCQRPDHEHTGWFLLIDNVWLDRLKVLSWHPVLAAQPEMHSVCGQRHLELLITHWLTYANLQFDADKMPEFALADHECRPGNGFNLPPPGQLVGELSVHRQLGSGLWAGSAEARKSIFKALSGACQERRPLPLRTAAVDSVQEDLLSAPVTASQRFNEYALG